MLLFSVATTIDISVVEAFNVTGLGLRTRRDVAPVGSATFRTART